MQGFGQRAYDQLLDVSSSFLETVQATALTMAEAHVTADADAARVGAAAAAAMDVWLPAYMAGLVNGAGPIELPASPDLRAQPETGYCIVGGRLAAASPEFLMSTHEVDVTLPAG